jgi:hypothetical protein
MNIDAAQEGTTPSATVNSTDTSIAIGAGHLIEVGHASLVSTAATENARSRLLGPVLLIGPREAGSLDGPDRARALHADITKRSALATSHMARPHDLQTQSADSQLNRTRNRTPILLKTLSAPYLRPKSPFGAVAAANSPRIRRWMPTLRQTTTPPPTYRWTRTARTPIPTGRGLSRHFEIGKSGDLRALNDYGRLDLQKTKSRSGRMVNSARLVEPPARIFQMSDGQRRERDENGIEAR